MAISPSKTADMALTIVRQRVQLADLQHLVDVAYRYWRHEFGDTAAAGDPQAAFDAEFRALAKRLGDLPLEPADIDADGTGP